MADRKLERRTILDPAVAGLLNDMENRQSDAALPRRPSGPMDPLTSSKAEPARTKTRRRAGLSQLPAPWIPTRCPALDEVWIRLEIPAGTS